MTSPTSIFQNPTTFFKTLKFKLFSIFVLCFCVSICLLGCVSRAVVSKADLPRSTYAPVRTDRIYDKNYTIGEKNVAYVGESFVRVKEFAVSKYRSADMIASTDFSITCPTFTILGNQNSGYPGRRSDYDRESNLYSNSHSGEQNILWLTKRGFDKTRWECPP